MSTDKRKLFVAAYLALPDGKAAAITAGYSEKTAKQQACRLMQEPWVIAEIAAGQAKLAKRFEITTEKVLQELAAIAFANIGDFLNNTGRIDIKALDKVKLAAVSELIVDILPGDVVRTRLKLHDKRAALVDLGKHLGLFRPAPVNPFADEADDTDSPDVPIRDSARALLFALATAMKAKAGKAAPAAAPIKH